MYKNNIDPLSASSVPIRKPAPPATAAATIPATGYQEAGKNDGPTCRTEWHRIASFGASWPNWAAKLSKGAHIEVEGELRHRIVSRERKSPSGRAVVVDIPGEIHVRTLRKLDRSGNQTGIRSHRRRRPNSGRLFSLFNISEASSARSCNLNLAFVRTTLSMNGLFKRATEFRFRACKWHLFASESCIELMDFACKRLKSTSLHPTALLQLLGDLSRAQMPLASREPESQAQLAPWSPFAKFRLLVIAARFPPFMLRSFLLP